jgi:hypothetical protein
MYFDGELIIAGAAWALCGAVPALFAVRQGYWWLAPGPLVACALAGLVWGLVGAAPAAVAAAVLLALLAGLARFSEPPRAAPANPNAPPGDAARALHDERCQFWQELSGCLLVLGLVIAADSAFIFQGLQLMDTELTPVVNPNLPPRLLSQAQFTAQLENEIEHILDQQDELQEQLDRLRKRPPKYTQTIEELVARVPSAQAEEAEARRKAEAAESILSQETEKLDPLIAALEAELKTLKGLPKFRDAVNRVR